MAGPLSVGEPVRVPVDRQMLDGDLGVPSGARGVVLFAHGSGSGRFSPRNRHVARLLREGGIGTLLLDLLTPEEEQIDLRTAHLRFDIGLLTGRVLIATDWLAAEKQTAGLHVGYFGASTGAAAALKAAASGPASVRAVVSRGGRPDLAGDALSLVRVPTLLIVGGEDTTVLRLNAEALEHLGGERRLEVIPGAGHLFEENDALDRVAELARDWFQRYLTGQANTP